jgi:putative hemolysin
MLEAVIIALLIVFNGLLALSELAVISSRRSRLKMLVEAGRPGSRRALALASNPGRFLSTVQIGITLVGIIAGAYSGATFGEALAESLLSLGLSEPVAEPLGFGLVIAVITYLSLIVGELVPKHMALRNAETIACMVAPAMTRMSQLASPFVSLLDASTKTVFKLMGKTPKTEGTVTEEEIRMLIAEAESAGVLEAGEQRMMVGVLRLGDRPVSGIMTPRTEVEWVDLATSEERQRDILAKATHSLLPVGEGSIDAMIGVVEARTLLGTVLLGQPFEIRPHVKVAPLIPDTMDALDVTAKLRDTDAKMALVHDEYGHFEGLVTPADILEAIAGFTPGEVVAEPKAVRRDDGSWLLSGWMPADEMADTLGLVLPERRDYQTVAGFVLSYLQRIPAVGESCVAQGWQFEVVDLDGRRIDKVLATRAPVTSRPSVLLSR